MRRIAYVAVALAAAMTAACGSPLAPTVRPEASSGVIMGSGTNVLSSSDSTMTTTTESDSTSLCGGVIMGSGTRC